jgi:toxin ParE1/3/4
MIFSFKPAARSEFFEAIAWYEEQQTGLGQEFSAAVDEALKRAQTHPERFPKAREARKIRLKRFRKYSIYFVVEKDVIGVVAVWHGARNPDELKRRLR